MARQITKAQFEALKPSTRDLVITERDGQFAYEIITDWRGNEIAFATYRNGECLNYTLLMGLLG